MTALTYQPHWAVLRPCPARDEDGFAVLDSNKGVTVAFYNGTSWGSYASACTNAGTSTDRAMDLAYEQTSGDGLVVYWKDASSKIGWRTWNGTTLSGESLLTLPTTDKVNYASLYPEPGSDRIVLMTLTTAKRLDSAIWSGSSWSGVSNFTTDATTSSHECFSLAFEDSSVAGLAVYCESSATQPRYRTLSGSTWSGESSAPAMSASPYWLRLASKPDTDTILMGGYDKASKIDANIWNGSSWGTNQACETNSGNSERRQFDVAFQPDGTNGLIVYAEKDQAALRYRTWNGTSWSGESTGATLSGYPRVVQLRPAASGSEIFVAASDMSYRLAISRWTGSSMTAIASIETNLTNDSLAEPFMLAPTLPSSAITVGGWREVPNPDP